MQKPLKKHNRNGFSCWELLALGVVFSVAGASLLPVLAQAVDKENTRENERAALCLYNLKQVANGLLQYQQDYDDRLPQAALAKKGTPDGSFGPAYGWAEAVQPYLKKREFLQCPSEKNTAQKDSMKPGYTDYWLNTLLAGSLAEDISKPSIMILLGDGDGGAPNSNARYHLRSMPKSWVSTPKSPATRHKGVGCYAFADGHVSLLAIADIGIKNENLQDLSRERLSKRID